MGTRACKGAPAICLGLKVARLLTLMLKTDVKESTHRW